MIKMDGIKKLPERQLFDISTIQWKYSNRDLSCNEMLIHLKEDYPVLHAISLTYCKIKYISMNPDEVMVHLLNHDKYELSEKRTDKLLMFFKKVMQAYDNEHNLIGFMCVGLKKNAFDAYEKLLSKGDLPKLFIDLSKNTDVIKEDLRTSYYKLAVEKSSTNLCILEDKDIEYIEFLVESKSPFGYKALDFSCISINELCRSDLTFLLVDKISEVYLMIDSDEKGTYKKLIW